MAKIATTRIATIGLVALLVGIGVAKDAQNHVTARDLLSPANGGGALVTEWGAVCDGVTDDGAAIQRALNAVAGTYRPLLINGKCATSVGLVARHQGLSPLVIECANDGSLEWIGPDNSGTLLTLGDPAGTEQDDKVSLRGCILGGSDKSHRPATALLLHSVSMTVIEDNTIAFATTGIVCDINCILNEFDRNLFSAIWGTALALVDANSNSVEHNEFYWCGTYCVDIQNGDSNLLFANDFEGTVGGLNSNGGRTLASVHLRGWANRLIANRYEDANAAAGTGMRSVVADGDRTTAVLIANSYGWNITPGGPAHFITINGGDFQFEGEQIGNPPPGGGSIVELNATTKSAWYGGANCDANNIWGGQNPSLGISIAACDGQYQSNVLNFANGATVNGLAATPGGKEPLCIDPNNNLIYRGIGGKC
jgi:hypothetical protein